MLQTKFLETNSTQDPIGEHTLEEFRGYLEKPRVLVELPIEDLLKGPRGLGVSYEFWEDLVTRYLRDPNYFDPRIREGILKGENGVSLEVFTKCESFYHTLTCILREEEAKFLRECITQGFESWVPLVPRHFLLRRRFTDVSLVSHNRDKFRFGDIRGWDAAADFDTGVFHQPQQFKSKHDPKERLTLACCQGITTRLIGKRLGGEHHLQYIEEYSAACEYCQDEADLNVRDFAQRGDTYSHRPRFHPAYFRYLRREDTLWERDVRILNFYTNYEFQKRFGLIDIQRQHEPRPTRHQFFIHLLESHFLEFHTKGDNESIQRIEDDSGSEGPSSHHVPYVPRLTPPSYFPSSPPFSPSTDLAQEEEVLENYEYAEELTVISSAYDSEELIIIHESPPHRGIITEDKVGMKGKGSKKRKL